MKSYLFFILFAVASLTNASSRYTPPAGEVLSELSRRSGLPEAVLQQNLANCDTNQTNMNFCSYRDQVAADLTLKHEIFVKTKQLPKRTDAINKRIAKWEKSRDASCEKSAEQEFGGGSMKPTAFAVCMTLETKRMIRWVENQK